VTQPLAPPDPPEFEPLRPPAADISSGVPGGAHVQQPRRRGRFWPAILRLMLFVVVSFALLLAFAFVLAGLPGLEESDLVRNSLALLAAAVGATALLLTIADMRPPAALGLPMNRLGMLHLGLGSLIGVSLSVGIVGLQWIAGLVEIQYGALEGSLTEVLWAPSLGVGFIVIACAASAEELLFRGYGLQQLMRATRPWAAVVVSSLLFGVVHATNPNSSRVAVLNTALFGILFGLVLVRHRSLWIPTGMHFGWNFSLACMGANLSGLTIRLTGMEIVPVGPAFWSGAEYGPEGSLLATLAVVGAAVLLWYVPLRRNGEQVLWDRDLPAGQPRSESGLSGLLD
jgi:hypothetical protein